MTARDASHVCESRDTSTAHIAYHLEEAWLDVDCALELMVLAGDKRVSRLRKVRQELQTLRGQADRR